MNKGCMTELIFFGLPILGAGLIFFPDVLVGWIPDGVAWVLVVVLFIVVMRAVLHVGRRKPSDTLIVSGSTFELKDEFGRIHHVVADDRYDNFLDAGTVYIPQVKEYINSGWSMEWLEKRKGYFKIRLTRRS